MPSHKFHIGEPMSRYRRGVALFFHCIISGAGCTDPKTIAPDPLGAAMKEALQSTLIVVLWIVFWLAGTIGGAVLQASTSGCCPISIRHGSSQSALASSASSRVHTLQSNQAI
jgi:hypothetical protein